ncbi:hypothetical protein G9A89_002323 [Geosiphon pyriformis]|nr:hypothetical protein G9A89_002323 [Geosiphon pyriformis]
MGKLKNLTFEVAGTVQGVWFRKYTKNKAVELNLVGWVCNSGVLRRICISIKSSLILLLIINIKFSKFHIRHINLDYFLETGTVKGVSQGEETKIEKFKKWLREEGSPLSKVTNADFTENDIDTVEFEGYSVRN